LLHDNRTGTKVPLLIVDTLVRRGVMTADVIADVRDVEPGASVAKALGVLAAMFGGSRTRRKNGSEREHKIMK